VGLPAAQNADLVQSVVPIRSGFEYLTLRCTTCGLVYDAQMHTDPMMSTAGGWIDSELVSLKSAAVVEAEGLLIGQRRDDIVKPFRPSYKGSSA
jgi:hypothetical protein